MLKTMRKLVLSLLIAQGLLSCVKSSIDNSLVLSNVDVKALEPYTSYTVPTKPGFASIVTAGLDTLAVVYESSSTKSSAQIINVPKAQLEAGEVNVTYSKDEIYKNISYNRYWNYLLFEDTRSGDADYNDLVMHGRVIQTTNYITRTVLTKISLQPVALGGMLNIKVGILYKEASDGPVKEAIIINDVRAELFNNNQAFPINTAFGAKAEKVSGQLIDKFQITSTEKDFKTQIAWFIECDGERMYAITSNFNLAAKDVVGKDGIPCGISLTRVIDYPVERCHITEAYPNFNSWLKDGKEDTLFNGKKKKNTFPATPPRTVPSLWDWDK